MSTNRDTSEHDTYRPSAYVATPERAGLSGDRAYVPKSASAALTAGAGILRIANVARVDFAEVLRFQILPLRSLDVCAIGILVWLRTKWRRSIKLD